jgi:hypothetical protein
VALAVDDKWGFDSEGFPVGEEWNLDAQRRAALALVEVKKILRNLGLPLPDHWPDEWNPQEAFALNPRDISKSVWPSGLLVERPLACIKCGERKELVFVVGSICASCDNTLNEQYGL